MMIGAAAGHLLSCKVKVSGESFTVNAPTLHATVAQQSPAVCLSSFSNHKVVMHLVIYFVGFFSSGYVQGKTPC